MNDTQPNYQEDEISLAELWNKAKSYFSYLWHYKFIIAGVALLFALGGFVKTWMAKPTYTANLTFALEQGDASGGLGSLASQFGFSVGGGGDGLAGDNLLSLMKSRRIVQNVLLSPVGQSLRSVRPRSSEKVEKTEFVPHQLRKYKPPKTRFRHGRSGESSHF